MERPHDCPLCNCGDDLSNHCEEHLEDAAIIPQQPCRPCEKFPDQFSLDRHYQTLDYDGHFFCPACEAADAYIPFGGK